MNRYSSSACIFQQGSTARTVDRGGLTAVLARHLEQQFQFALAEPGLSFGSISDAIEKIPPTCFARPAPKSVKTGGVLHVTCSTPPGFSTSHHLLSQHGEPLLARMMVLEATTLSSLVERAGQFLRRCTASRGGQPGLAAPAPSGLCSQVLYNGNREICMLPINSCR